MTTDTATSGAPSTASTGDDLHQLAREEPEAFERVADKAGEPLRGRLLDILESSERASGEDRGSV